jgi:hypothetical protein
MESENTNYGLERFYALSKSEEQNDGKELDRISRRIAYFDVLSRAFARNTYLKAMIIFAHERQWLEFNVSELKDWLCQYKNSQHKGEPNNFAHKVLDAAIRGVNPPVKILQVKNADKIATQKKQYFFDQNFKRNVKEFLNFIIPKKEEQNG